MSDGLIVAAVNLGGWVVVLYLAKLYFEEMKNMKVTQANIIRDHNNIVVEQKLQAQRIAFLEKTIEDIDVNIEEIKDTLKTNNAELIKELKEQLKNKH
jgi:hypothetical protein